MSEDNPNLEALLDAALASDEDGLLEEPTKEHRLTTEDRLDRAFLEIAEFYRTHGRRPSSQTRNIAERRLGARLDGFLADQVRADAVADLDDFGLLTPESPPKNIDELLAHDDLDLLGGDDDIFDLTPLPSRIVTDKDVEVAKRKQARDFSQFENLFKVKHAELAAGDAVLRNFSGISTIRQGSFFVLGGVMLFVSEVGERDYKVSGGSYRSRERLRVIFENGTESSMYRTSLAIRLAEQNGRAVVPADHALSLDELGDADIETGHIYVLRSLSSDPQIAGLEDLHKIGFSRTPVSQRIKNAIHEPTYLMAPVEVVADYRVYNMRPSALESLIHRVFSNVRLNLSQVGPNGEIYNPSEWFIVPINAIDQAIEMTVNGDITDFTYDPTIQTFIYRGVEGDRG
jgi:hypothetical protein